MSSSTTYHFCQPDRLLLKAKVGRFHVLAKTFHGIVDQQYADARVPLPLHLLAELAHEMEHHEPTFASPQQVLDDGAFKGWVRRQRQLAELLHDLGRGSECGWCECVWRGLLREHDARTARGHTAKSVAYCNLTLATRESLESSSVRSSRIYWTTGGRCLTVVAMPSDGLQQYSALSTNPRRCSGILAALARRRR